MIPELKQKWLDALRSGKYEKGFNYLHAGNQFCCLGVLCDVAGYEWKLDDEACEDDVYSCLAGEEMINYKELKKLELPSEIHDKAFLMNDGGINTIIHSFSEIADWLEENL